MELIETIKQLDTSFFFVINRNHNTFFDKFFYLCSDKYFWIPFYAIIVFLIIRKYKPKTIVLILLSIILLVFLTDQTSVKIFKENFMRYRPCHNLKIKHLIHLVGDSCGGMYGFVSSHATNTAGLAMFLFLLFKNNFSKYAWLIFIWVALNAYSRVYLGVHYPADVLVGALLGILIGFGIFRIFSKIEQLIYLKKDNKVIKY